MNDERGSISLFVVLLAVAFLGLGGVVIDAGSAIVASRRAGDVAENAARAGVQAATTPASTDVTTFDPQRARTAALTFLAGERLDGEVAVQGEVVQVVVHARQPTTFLRAVGITHLDASGSGAARALVGVSEAQP